MKRHQLPPRRHCLSTIVTWRNSTGAESSWSITVGFDEAWKVREIFGDGHKTGTDMEALFDDACILISMVLQSGISVAELAEKLGREGADPGMPAASFVGFIVKKAAEIEAGYSEAA